MFYLPVAWYLTVPWYAETGMPDLGLAGAGIHDAVGALWLPAVGGYALFQWRCLRAGKPRNLPKLLLLAATVPLHAAAFSSPLLALFVVPLVTAGHNIQYHRFVWDYGRKRYRGGRSLAAGSFRNPFLYLALGFTFLAYRGPLVTWFAALGASFLDEVALPLAGLMAGAPGSAGGQAVAAAILGWAMQHYWLDARIWRVSKDERLRRILRTPSTT